MPVAIIGPKFYAWDNDTGKPLAFGKVFTYQSGTNTPKATFTSESGATENANPVILNGAGYADIYLNGTYKIVVEDADGVQVWTKDPVSSPDYLVKLAFSDNSSGNGSDLVAHTGTTDTVTEALDKRTIYVGSVAEMEALSLTVGTNVYLTEDGRAGEFVVKAGTPPSDPQKGVYIVLANGNYAERKYNGDVYAEWFGALPGSSNDQVTKSATTAAMNLCLEKGLGLVHFGPGDYYLADFQYNFGVTGRRGLKGIKGAGAERTILHFSNLDDVAAFTFSENCFWQEFSDFKAVAEGTARTQNFFDSISGTGGSPRTNMHDIRFENFKDPVRSFSWVSTFARLVSFNSLVAFTWTGTSCDITSCYAVNSRYGHVIGGVLQSDGDLWTTGIDPDFLAEWPLVYSTMNNCAADGSENGAYILCGFAGVILNSCGVEFSQESNIVFPEVIAGTFYGAGEKTGKVTINSFKADGDAVDQVKILQNYIVADFNDYLGSLTDSDTVYWGAGVTEVLVNFNRSTIPWNPIPSTVQGASIDGVSAGEIYKDWNKGSGFAFEGGTQLAQGLQKYKTIIRDFLGTDRLRLAYVGSSNLHYVFAAKISIYPVNRYLTFSGNTHFSGDVKINAIRLASDGNGRFGFTQDSINTNSDVVVSVDVSQNPGNDVARDMVVEFSGTSLDADAKYIMEVELLTNVDFNSRLSTRTEIWKAIYVERI